MAHGLNGWDRSERISNRGRKSGKALTTGEVKDGSPRRKEERNDQKNESGIRGRIAHGLNGWDRSERISNRGRKSGKALTTDEVKDGSPRRKEERNDQKNESGIRGRMSHGLNGWDRSERIRTDQNNR